MEGSVSAAPRPARRRRVLVLAVAAVVVAAGFFVWWGFIRPRTIAEVFDFNQFQPGTSVTVQGTITAIYREDTSYGPRVSLQLDHYVAPENSTPLEYYNPCNGGGQILGDPNATYAIGQNFQTTLHFQRYTINGDPAVSAPELTCPFPLTFSAIQEVMDAVSRVDRLLLVYNTTEPGGWMDYQVFAPNAMRYNLSVLPATLRKASGVPTGPVFPAGSAVDSFRRWASLTALQYIGISGSSSSVFPVVDEMPSLADGTSVNGSLRFVDANGDHVLDDGDRLDVRIPPTSTGNAWDTYLLDVGVVFSGNPTYVGARHYILNGPDGPLEPAVSEQPMLANLAWAGDQPGPPIKSTLRVSSFPFGTPPLTGSVSFELYDQNGFLVLSGNLRDLPAKTTGGQTFSYEDGNLDGRLDQGDLFTLSGAANRSRFDLGLWSAQRLIGFVTWIVGYGIPAPVSTQVTFTVQGSGPWQITAGVPMWSPEYALDRTLSATLTENGHVVLANVSLVNGTVGTFANGTLSFTDADGDGYLSTGDYFTLNGDPAALYVLQVTVLFNEGFRAVVA